MLLVSTFVLIIERCYCSIGLFLTNKLFAALIVIVAFINEKLFYNKLILPSVNNDLFRFWRMFGYHY